MSDAQIFEFRSNALIHFRLSLRPTFLTVSTTRKKGGEAAKTWEVSFARLDAVRIAERIGARTRNSSIYLKPHDGDPAMFGWQKNAIGASDIDREIYYQAAIATLRAIADARPDLKATIGPDGGSALVGTILGAAVFIGAAYIGIGEINTIFWITASIIAGVYASSAATSGALKPTRTVSLLEATEELTANAER